MRRLAAAVNVTVRALYHHVDDRQDVIDGVARLLVAGLPEHDFDVDDWRGSIRGVFRDAREAYRRHPRALLIGMEEQVTPAGVEAERILSPEWMLAYFVRIGLPLPDALALRMQLLTQVLGFVLSVDYPADRASPAQRERLLDPVPSAWLAAFPELTAPTVRAAAARPALTPDEAFEHIIDTIIRGLEPRIGQTMDDEAQQRPPEDEENS
ncbi:AcrR family transcriptional regulator [Microbacterium invictum]|uniref:AcrR family transcriptional regulator n=2 Tax=Microbacterium invictum TaxID=515415 RepID=A0AA40VMZ3_9MICO|nr:AcrR family transcriptional regulator [Microbacterium invictum]